MRKQLRSAMVIASSLAVLVSSVILPVSAGASQEDVYKRQGYDHPRAVCAAQNMKNLKKDREDRSLPILFSVFMCLCL